MAWARRGAVSQGKRLRRPAGPDAQGASRSAKRRSLQHGDDVALLALGSMVVPAVEAARLLAQDGVRATVVNARFCKPLDKKCILTLAARVGLIVTIEEHALAGGFGSAVLECLEEAGLFNVRVKRLGRARPHHPPRQPTPRSWPNAGLRPRESGRAALELSRPAAIVRGAPPAGCDVAAKVCVWTLLFVERGLFQTRAKAKAAIMAGWSMSTGQRADKAGSGVSPRCPDGSAWAGQPFVSRGGLKLQHALDRFGVPVAGRRCIDVGASTGGFTDCLLQRGAAKVYAVDVGYGQLDWKLRQDPRVVVVERTNFRHVQPGDLPVVDLIVIDVSFISLLKMLPAGQGTLKDDGDIVALIKPQFEAGRKRWERRRRGPRSRVHREVITRLLAAAQDAGLERRRARPIRRSWARKETSSFSSGGNHPGRARHRVDAGRSAGGRVAHEALM